MTVVVTVYSVTLTWRHKYSLSSGGAGVIVTGVLMTVDSECSVAISSLSEGECSCTLLHSSII